MKTFLFLIVSLPLLFNSFGEQEKVQDFPKPAYKIPLETGLYQDALPLALEALNKIPSKEISNEKASILMDVGNIYIGLENYLESSVFYLKALQLLQDYPAADLNMLALCHNELAYTYDMIGYSNKCIFHYEKAFELWSNNFYDDYANMSSIFINLRHTFTEYGDMKKLNFYMDQLDRYAVFMLETLRNDPSNLALFKIFYYYNKISYYSTLLEVDLALSDWEKLKQLHSYTEKHSLEKQEKYFLASLENIGYMFKKLKKFDQAIFYYKSMKGYQQSEFFEMKMNANIAIVYYDAADWSNALPYCDKALEYFYQNDFSHSGLTLKSLKAELLFRFDKTTESKILLSEIFSQWTGETLDFNQIRKISLADLKGKNSLGYINILLKTAYTAYEIGTNKKDKLSIETAFNLYWLASLTFESYYLKGVYNPSLALLQNNISEGLLQIMTAYPDLNKKYLTTVIEQIEANESQQYLKEFISKNSQNLSGTFEYLKTKNDLIIEISYLENNTDTSNNVRYLEKKKQLSSLNEQLQVKKSGDAIFERGVNLKEIQQSLRFNEKILKYYVSGAKVFGIIIGNQRVDLKLVGSLEKLNLLVNDFKDCLSDPKCTVDALAQALYVQLLKPFELERKDQLIILPAGSLNYIPFEALKNEKGELVLANHPVSYTYSLKLFNVQRQKDKLKLTNFLAAYAPNYSSEIYAGIKNNQKEAISIAHNMNGELFIGPDASKKSFIENMTNFQIHHLALHAEQDAFTFENSALIFSNDERMEFYELYNLHFPAELVVLSACNSGIGSLEPGEGLMGLAKALTYAGVYATVNSLWAVSDKETGVLMTKFYEQLKKGVSKDEALRMAKLEFIQQNPLKTHPYFWAGFTLNGNAAPILQKQRWPLVVLLIVVLILAVWVRRIIQKKSIQLPF
jgi:CHAT domain-containing protein